jgi:hypothetical protein
MTLLTHPYSLKKSKTFGLVGSEIPIAPLLSLMEIQRFGFGLDLIRNTNY